jgi:uncharacterized protein (TIGR02145 family)
MRKYLEFVAISVFLLSCADDTRDNPQDERAVNYIGSGSYGSVTYEGQTYKTVVIGTQTWFAENLNYNPGTGNSVCYDNQASNCDTYGRLYDWSTAKTACPAGWHLPSDAEWDALVTYSGFPNTAGTKLKARSGWNGNGNGTDDYGFSALPGGGGSGSSGGLGYLGFWWSATESSASLAYFRYMIFDDSSVNRDDNGKFFLFSVRCVKD